MTEGSFVEEFGIRFPNGMMLLAQPDPFGASVRSFGSLDAAQHVLGVLRAHAPEWGMDASDALGIVIVRRLVQPDWSPVAADDVDTAGFVESVEQFLAANSRRDPSSGDDSTSQT